MRTIRPCHFPKVRYETIIQRNELNGGKANTVSEAERSDDMSEEKVGLQRLVEYASPQARTFCQVFTGGV